MSNHIEALGEILQELVIAISVDQLLVVGQPASIGVFLTHMNRAYDRFAFIVYRVVVETLLVELQDLSSVVVRFIDSLIFRGRLAFKSLCHNRKNGVTLVVGVFSSPVLQVINASKDGNCWR